LAASPATVTLDTVPAPVPLVIGPETTPLPLPKKSTVRLVGLLEPIAPPKVSVPSGSADSTLKPPPVVLMVRLPLKVLLPERLRRWALPAFLPGPTMETLLPMEIPPVSSRVLMPWLLLPAISMVSALLPSALLLASRMTPSRVMLEAAPERKFIVVPATKELLPASTSVPEPILLRLAVAAVFEMPPLMTSVFAPVSKVVMPPVSEMERLAPSET
jgi:hypothetical protein